MMIFIYSYNSTIERFHKATLSFHNYEEMLEHWIADGYAKQKQCMFFARKTTLNLTLAQF